MSDGRGSDTRPRPAVTLREGHADDLVAMAAVFLACWRTSYRTFLPERVIALYDEPRAQALWRRSLARAASSGGSVLVAEAEALGVVGVVRVGRDPDDASGGHVYSLYVHPAAQGWGVGRSLLEAADERFRADGVREASLWVFEANADARRFYARLGWAPDGVVRVEAEYGAPELHLVRPVPGPTASRPL